MKAGVNEFLTAYRELEEYLAVNSTETPDIKELECAEAGLRARLHLCRITRNYIAHNNGGVEFCGVTPAMTEFLRDTLDYVKGFQETCGEAMLPPRRCGAKKPDAPFFSAVETLKNNSRLRFIPVIENNKLVGVITPRSVLGWCVAGNKPKDIRSNLKRCKIRNDAITFAGKKSSLEVVRRKGLPVCVTDTGGSSGNVLGFIMNP